LKKRLILAALLLLTPLPTHAVLAVVQAASHQTLNATATTIGSGDGLVATGSGNLLVLTCYQPTNNTSTLAVTDSASQSGYLQAGSYASSGTTDRFAMFYKENSASITSITGTWSGSLVATVPCVVYEISGAATSSSIDATVNASQNATGTTITSGSLTTTNANDILIFGVGENANTSGWSPGAGFAIQSGGSITAGRAATSTEIVSSTQSGVTTTMSWTTTGNKIDTVFAAFKAASGVTTTGTLIGGASTIGGATVIQ